MLFLQPKLPGKLGREIAVGQAHLFQRCIERLDLRDVGSGKSEIGLRGKKHGLALRVGTFSDGHAVGEHRLEQPHRLKEIEAVALLEEPFSYRMICSPAKGSHRFQTSSRWVLSATSSVNELTEA